MLYVVTGAPASGKSTWVRENAKPGDIRFDSDALTNTLTGRAPSKHHHDNLTKRVSRKAREAGIAEALTLRSEIDVWVIISNLSPEEEARFRQYGARFIVVDPGEEENMRRCREQRPGYKQRLVTAWYARRASWPEGATIIRPEPVDDLTVPAAGDGGPTVRVVTGPPAAGKSTFVRQHRRPGDVTIDFDTIANVLAGLEPDNHEHEQHIKQITKATRQAAIDKAVSQAGSHTVWIIHSTPSASLLAKYRAAGAVIDVVDPGKEVVMKRVKQERPKPMLVAAAKWYDNKPEPTTPLTTTERGLGWEHQKDRDRLLAVHVDGTPCWWCGKPMYRDKTRNHDGLPLAADHGHARKHGGTKADKLLHFSCNSSRKAGENDAQRPAAQREEQEVTERPTVAPRPAQAPSASSPASVFDWPSF